MTSSEQKKILAPYEEGEIQRRLLQLNVDAGPKSDDVSYAFRAAASVLAAVNPITLRAMGEVGEKANALVILPLLQPAHPAEKNEGFPWTLSRDERRSALRLLRSRSALIAALAANEGTRRPLTVLQKTLTAAIHGEFEDIAQAGSEQLANLEPELLAALLITADWLEATEVVDSLPRIWDLQTALDRRRDRDALQALASRVFTGREKESKQIKTHLDSTDSRILWISAAGGTGKSALIANTLLAWASAGNRGIRVDLDHSHVRPERPTTLLVEAAKQLLRQEPRLKSQFLEFVEHSQWSAFEETNIQFESRQSGYSSAHLVQQFISILSQFCSEDNRVALCIDTFEEAQFLGVPVEERLLRMLMQLTEVPGLRVIVSGRAGPMSSRLTSDVFDLLHLQELPISAAESLLKKMLLEINPNKVVDQVVVQSAVSQLGGNPLTLRLAARLLAEENLGDIHDFSGIRKEALQSQLYSRVLSHLHDETVRRLAMPGLTVRRITPDIIRHVLAVPCGLTVTDDNQANDLFTKLARENTLVDREGDMLVHRQDIRRVMIAAMPSSLEATVSEIDRRGAEWWANQVGGVARAEEIYHRLRLGHMPAEITWDSSAAVYLRNALEEFPVGSMPRMWLGDKLGVIFDSAEWSQATQEEWELQTGLEAQRLLDAHLPEDVLEVLARRKDRLRSSSLFAIETRALLALGKPLEALRVAREGLGESESDVNPIAIDLLKLIALIEERLGNPGPAVEASKRAVQIAGKQNDVLLQLSAHLRLFRSQRNANVPTTEPSRQFAKSIAEKAGPSLLISNPDILRELAAELGDLNTEFLKWAISVLDEAIQSAGPIRTVRLLEELRVVSEVEAQTLLLSDSRELAKVAKSRVAEQIYKDDSSQVTVVVQQFLREATDAILLRDLTDWSRARHSMQTPRSSTADGDLRNVVEQYIKRLPQDSIERIARYGAGIEQSNRQFQKRSSSEIADELIDRASRSGNLAKLIAQIESSVAHVLPNEDLTILKNAREMIEKKEP